MAELRCPGQDQRYWTPEDIFDVACPSCGSQIEFFKDEPMHACPGCEAKVRNPRINTGCLEWCKSSKDCVLGKELG
ncbi:MAG: hypothetical protein HQL31_02065 [Planctomycetes bacterium]|nr:hypothetical protein [Planctomycetota bacterium]